MLAASVSSESIAESVLCTVFNVEMETDIISVTALSCFKRRGKNNISAVISQLRHSLPKFKQESLASRPASLN